MIKRHHTLFLIGKSLRVLVTAGPTREFVDPVRFLSNPSSGRMGYALAEEAARQGGRVVLISGPVSLPPPAPKIHLVKVVSALEMYKATLKEAKRADIIIMVAAVSDFRPARYLSKKLKKSGRGLTVRFVPNPDILKELGQRKKKGQVLVGFAAETDRLIENAGRKMLLKNLDMIVVNRVGVAGSGFESDRNQATILMKCGTKKRLPLMTKTSLAQTILGCALRANH